MQAFSDTTGRKWLIDVNYTTAKRVKQLTGLDLFDDEAFEKIGKDNFLLLEIICAICEDEMKERGVSANELGKALSGDVIDNAVTAFMESYINFTPNERRRQILRSLVSKAKAAEPLLLARAETAVERMTSETIADLVSGKSAASSQASAESRQDG